MTSNSSITFGSSVTDSFGDFLPDKSEDEDEYDAFNDETFGNEGQMEDWEEQHEKLANIASDSSVDKKRKEEKSSSGSNNNSSSSSSRETHNHDQGLTSPSSTPFRDTLLKNATATSLDTSFLENFSTLGLRENLHNQSIFHDPAIVNLQKQSVPGSRNISLNTANHLPFGPLTQPDIWSTSAEKPKVAQTDGSDPSSSHSKDLSKMKTLEEIEQDFFSNAIKRPIRAEDLEATLLAGDNRREDPVNQVKPPYSDSVRNAFERNGGEGDGIGWNPLTGGASMAHMIPNGTVIPTGLLSRESPWKPTEEELLKAAPKSCAELEKDLLSNASPVESKAEAPEKARNQVGPRPMSRTPDHLHQQHQHQHQQRFHPWAPLLPPVVGLPEPNPLIPLARGFFAARNFPQPSYLPRSPIPMSPFPIRHPYANNIRYPNMLNPLQRMPQRNMMPFPGDMVRPRFVPHPLLHPPFHPHMLQQHHLQQQQQQQQSLKMLYQRNQMANMQNRTRPPSRNGYTGLMTQKEKDWLIKIQLTQLEFGDPYVEDYYYVRMTSKRLSMKNKANPKDNKQNGDTALILPERGKLPNSSGPSYVPRQFEGSLGKISVSNINCPRKLLDYDKREASGESDGGRPSTPAGRLELKKFRQLLLEVEKLYLVLLSIDDEDKRILALPEDARVPHIEKRKELCDLLFAGITDETSGHINQKIASIRKGCSLIFRSLLLLGDVKQKSLLVGELLNIENFPLVVTQKDQTVYGFNYGEILIDCIKTIKDCDFSNLLHIAKSLNDAAMVAKYECGKEIIQTLIEQSALFKKNEDEQAKWSSFVTNLMSEVEDIAQLRALCAEHLSQSKA